MSWIGAKYRRYREIQRHRAGEIRALRGAAGTTRRLYLSDWAVLSRLELRRQERHPDHRIRWMPLEEILAFCEPYDVISFDVFDTLLIRRTGAPASLFVLLERMNGIPDFAEARQAAERAAREEKGEVTLEDIYLQLGAEGAVPDADAAREAEWEAEKSGIAPHPRMLPLVKALKQRGKRVIAVSDMYLSSAQIRELLRLSGYPELDGVFVSCEEGVGKAGGAIYRKVAEKLLPAESAGKPGLRVLHMGDNGEADGECAAAAGWDTALLQNPAKLPWEYFAVTPYAGDMIASALRWQRRYDGAEESGPSIGDGAPETEGEAGASRRNPVYEIGYQVAGPLTVGFCQWIRRMQAERGWEKLFFSARDGWIMHQVYTKYFGEAEYLPVSRAATQMLDVERQARSYCDNNLPAHLGTGETVGAVLEGMGLAELIPAWTREGLRPEAPLDGEARKIAERLIIRDREKIAELFGPARQNALRWLRERLAGVSRAVIIDTGWKGSAGATLRAFARENGLETVLDTALMGTSRAPSVAVREEEGELFSWLYSPSHDRDRLARQYDGGRSLACTLMEMLFMTTQPQLLSYAGEGFTYGPAETRFREMTESLQAGTLAFAEDYFRVIRRLGRIAPGADGAGEIPDFPIPAAAAYRYFEELILEKDRLREAFGSYVFHMAPTPEKAEITFEDRMRENGWIGR